MTTMDFKICGIPCIIEFSAQYTKPDLNSWASDIDYYGGWDIDYTVCDRNGRYAAWLERKITPEIESDIESAIIEYCRS